MGATVNHVPIQSFVPPEVRDHVRTRARELGVSQSQYVEAILRLDLENHVVTPEALRASEGILETTENPHPFIQERLAG